MKQTVLSVCSIVLSAAAVVLGSIALSNVKSADAVEQTSETNVGEYAYFNLDRVIEEYNFAIDQRATLEKKIESINQEVNRRGSKLEKDVAAWQEKIEKGLLTRSTAEIQGQKLQEQQNEFQNYAAQKQQELNELQVVTMNEIADAVKTYIDEFNEKAGYTMIFSTQGNLLPAPVVTGKQSVDITDTIISGLNSQAK